MKIMKLSSCILFPFIFFCVSPVALALSTARFPEFPSKNKPLSVQIQTEFYRSNSNYAGARVNSLGDYDPLPKENYFEYFAFHPSVRYYPLPHYMSFELFANSFYASSKTLNTNRSVFRPTVLGGGVSVYHKFKKLYTGFELRGGYPLVGNFQNANELIIGDSSYFVEPGVWLLFQGSKFFYLYYNLSFRYRIFSLSSVLFNRLGGVLQTQYIDAGFSIDTFTSVLDDQFTLQPEKRWNLLKHVNGGSFRFYSVNPYLLSLTTWMEFKFQPLFATLYFNGNTFGDRYARGLTFGVMTKLKWSTKSALMDRKRKPIKYDFEDLDSSFRKESDPEDSDSSSKEKSYFEEEEDPYSNKNINNELKKELNSLKY